MIEENNIYCIDCVEGMKKLPEDSIDITITSPPYNAGKNIRGNFYKGYADNLSEEEYYNFICNVITECIRVTKYYTFFNFQLLTGNKNAYLRILNDFRFNIKEILIWSKDCVQPAIQPTCLSSGFEFIIVFTKPEYAAHRTFEKAYFNNRLKGQLNLNIIRGKSASVKTFNDDNGDNKAVFPQYLVKWFIDKFTKEDDLIMDPFMGCGTTAYVSKQNNRRYIGFEIEQAQIDLANSKMRQTTL